VRIAGYTHYTVWVNGVNIDHPQAWGDYLWDPVTNAFVYTLAATYPGLNYWFAVRNAGDIWYNYWLGYFLDTTPFANGLANVQIEFWGAIAGVQFVSTSIFIDNGWPVASINHIQYYPSYPGNLTSVQIATCGTATGQTDVFSFGITAWDYENNLLSYSLGAVWANNAGGGITSDSYANHVSATKQWNGVTSTELPSSLWHASVPGDPYSYNCAHTFILTVWDRAINGWNYIHSAQYTRSITLNLTPPF